MTADYDRVYSVPVPPASIGVQRPPFVDGQGTVYLAGEKALFGVIPGGGSSWNKETGAPIVGGATWASGILVSASQERSELRIYIGTLIRYDPNQYE